MKNKINESNNYKCVLCETGEGSKHCSWCSENKPKGDIENFSKEQLQDELLKVVDEMFNRKYSLNWIVDHIQHGKRH